METQIFPTFMRSANKIRCLVVDDEPPAREILEKYIEGVEALQISGSCSNAVEALSLLQCNPVDLLFLDIQMPHILGTSFIRTLQNPPKVIFTTAFRDFAVEGFELNAVDYLVKPIAFERFLQAVNKILKLNVPDSWNNHFMEPFSNASHPFLYFRSDRKMVKIFLEEILYIESLKDYIKVVTTGKTIITKQAISSLEEMLPKDVFLRIHRSFIIAMNKVESFNADLVEIGKIQLPVGRSFKHNVSKMLNSS